MIAAYVSGHGFGHSTRTAEVLRVLRTVRPELRITVVTSAPRKLFDAALGDGFEYRAAQCDTGLAQVDALRIDETLSLRDWRVFRAGWGARVEEEARFLEANRASLVLADIPPLAFAAADAAGVPAVGLANFSWDWIYRHLGRREPEFLDAAEADAQAYATAHLLLRLPFAGDMRAFPRVEDIPLVARKPRAAREDLRRDLRLDDRPCVLVSFGGVGLELRADTIEDLTTYQFLVSSGPAAAARNVHIVDDVRLRRLGWRYIDLVGAADIVLTKPGYGIVSDAVGARARLVYTDRGDFPEYEILVGAMPAYLPSVYVPQDDLRAGRLGPAIEQVLSLPWPDKTPPSDGAFVAAEGLSALAI